MVYRWDINIHPKAESHLDEIYDYTFDEYGLEQAEKYISELNSVFYLLSEVKGLGTRINKEGNYRKHPHKEHMIFFYYGENNRLEILAIIHQSSDWMKYIKEDL